MYNSGKYLDINEIKSILPNSFLPLEQVHRKLIFRTAQGFMAITNSRIYDEYSGEHLWSSAFLDFFRKYGVKYI